MIGRVLLFLSVWLLPLFTEAATFVAPNSTWRYFKGYSEASSPDPTAWRAVGFDDSGWSVGQAAFYYENQPGSANAYTGNTQLSDMFGGYTCVFLRRTFVVTNVNDVAALQVAGYSDDGFLAWINGHLVAQFNMPSPEAAYSDSSSPALSEPISWWTNELSNFDSFLVAGTNVLAVQAFNSSKSDSSDFIINPALYYTPDTSAPTLTLLYPVAGQSVRQLRTIEVGFSEPVTGVDAEDLLVGGQAATNLTVLSASQYLFTFPPPAPGPVLVTWAGGHGIRDLGNPPRAFAGGSWTYVLNPDAPLPDVFISEFMASNSGGPPNSVRDELGESPDWIELYNAGSAAVSLTGWALTDNASRLMKWRFPATLLPANGYLLVMASGRDTNVAGQLHTNFKLAASPSFLALVDANTNIVSAFAPEYPQQYPDISFGRDRLDPTLLGYFTNATPKAANATQGAGFGPEVQFSRASGTFFDNFSLTLSTADPNWDIRYVLVATNLAYGTPAVTNIPTGNSTLYTGPIVIANTAQVRARAFPRQAGYWPGPPRTESYIRLSPSVAAFSFDLPVILLHNLAGGALSASAAAEDQNVIVMTFEPVNGRTSLTNPPTLVSRGGFNIRGSSTAWVPQYNLALELWDEYNQDREAEFLGLPAESDWVLYAQNSYDPSYLHNPLAHQLSRDIGRYSSRTRFAEVFLNTAGGMVTFSVPAYGNYFGLYTVEEKVKRDNHRVNIPALEPHETNAVAITGGYLLKIDRADADERTFYDSYLRGNIVYQDPPGLEMETAARQPQRDYITGYFSQFGAALWGNNYTNPATGYAAYIDVDSWVDHHILNVLTFNVDALRLSGFFYKDRGKKIEMGPLWDFDRSLGSPDGRPFNPRLWRVQASGDQGTDFFGNPNLLGVRWWQRLFTDPDFWQRWIDRWTDLRRDAFTTNRLHAWVDTLGNQARQAQTRQVLRWSGESVPRSGTTSANGYWHTFPGTYQGELDFLKRWLGDRVDFIDTNFLRAPVFSAAGGAITQGFQLTITATTIAANSTTYYTLDGTDPRLPGGRVNPLALSNRGTTLLTLTNNARVFARNHNLAHSNLTGGAVGGNPPISSPWSGSTIATFVVATPPLAITEIMYHPAPPAGGTYSAGDFEFIELKNVGAQPLNLIGVRFTNGLSFAFTATNAITNLGPGQYCVLVKNLAAFLARYPGVTNIAGVFTNSLDNAGERLALEGALREPILNFRYDDQWYPVTDGAGFSLVIRDETAPFHTWTNAASWRASAFLGGSPGGADPLPPDFPAVVINEILTHTDPPEVDSIELRNLTASPVDIGGWFLTDDTDEPRKYRIPSPTAIAANGYVVFSETEYGTNPVTGFGLSSLGERVYLYSGDGTNLTGYWHGFAFGAQLNGVTFGRHVSSDGREHCVTEVAKTLGSPNRGPQVGPVVINEIMYAPPPFGATANTLEEYVELRNITGQSVPLFDPLHPTNTWKLGGGIEFTFPPGTTLPPWSYVLVANFDPAFDPVMLDWFRARYGLDAGVPIFGPYRGNLANEGERIELLFPDRPQVSPSPIAGFVPYVLAEAVDYANSPPWPAGANGTGYSLQRVASVAFGNDPANWVAGAASPGRVNAAAAMADTDGDGLPDEWELAHGLDPKDAGGDNSPAGDPDGDRATNWEEYIAGTDPLDGADYLRLERATPAPPCCHIEFNTHAGRTYRVLATTNLAAEAWFPVGSSISGNGQPVILYHPLSGSPTFYRLQVARE